MSIQPDPAAAGASDLLAGPPARYGAVVTTTRRGLLQGAAALLAASCGREAPGAKPPEAEVVVFAAASLRDVLTTIAGDFRREHPGVDVRLSFAGSQELRVQIEHGAPADVFISADERHMHALHGAGRVGEPVVIARNEPVVVVGRTTGDAIRSFADLPSAARLVIGTAEVPIGRYTGQILDRAAATQGADFRARVEARVVSRELDVRQVLAKVVMGEADAGIVYRTDALGAGDAVRVVPIPAAMNVVATYPAAIVEGAAHPTLARAWIERLRSEGGQGTLRRAGFAPP